MLEKLNPSNNQKYPWLDVVETASVLGSVGASIASIFTNQVALASIPLSITVMLNLANRRLQLEALSRTNQSAISQLVQEDVKILEKVGVNNQQLVQLQELTSDYQQVTSSVQEHSQQIQSNQNDISYLVQEQSYTQGKIHAINEQLTQSMEVVRKVGYLQEIDSSTQAIRIAPYNADAYYKRGLSFQALGDKQGSISDFTEAIQLNPSHASAYYSRGLAHIDLGNKKRAVQDLREAAKLFFEAEDIASYQLAKDSSKQIHELNSSVGAEDSAQVAVGGLFR